MNAQEVFLAHHGILGQRWGRRNGPPYPLDSDDHSASEKKAGWRKSLDNSSRSDKKARSIGSNDSGSERQGFHLTDKQKKYVKIGLGVTAAALAAYGAYRLADSGALDNFVSLGKNQINLAEGLGDASNLEDIDIFDEETGFKKLAREVSDAERMAQVNPSHFQHNCKECSYAFAQSEIHGIDVSANDKSMSGNLYDFVSKNFGIDPDTSRAYGTVSGNRENIKSRLEKQLLKRYKDGDVGAVAVNFSPEYLREGAQESGHAFNWRIKDGMVKFIDSQGDEYGKPQDVGRLFQFINPSKEVEFVNYSDLPFNKDTASKIMRNRD